MSRRTNHLPHDTSGLDSTIAAAAPPRHHCHHLALDNTLAAAAPPRHPCHHLALDITLAATAAGVKLRASVQDEEQLGLQLTNFVHGASAGLQP